jgi:hypothetical protein
MPASAPVRAEARASDLAASARAGLDAGQRLFHQVERVEATGADGGGEFGEHGRTVAVPRDGASAMLTRW